MDAVTYNRLRAEENRECRRQSVVQLEKLKSMLPHVMLDSDRFVQALENAIEIIESVEQ